MASNRRAAKPEQSSAHVCHRCGLGFIATPNYMDFLHRWGAKVVVPVQCPTCFWTLGALPKQDGKIKWFSKKKHHGCISCPDGSELHFEQNQLVGNGRPSEAGQPVQFHVALRRERPQALNVEHMEHAEER